MHRVDVERQPHVAIVVASGELDAYVVPDLTSAFAELRGARSVIADLEHVSFLDSSALGQVVRAARDLEESGAELRIVLPRGPARRIFEITGLDRALPVVESRRIALGDLEG